MMYTIRRDMYTFLRKNQIKNIQKKFQSVQKSARARNTFKMIKCVFITG